MFYYYGGKARLAGRYPPPAHPLIVEPFAGGAGYSMHHLARRTAERAILVEKDPRVVELWRRLLAMTPAEVLALPVPEVGSETSDFFHMTTATSNAIARLDRMKVTPRMPDTVTKQKRRVATLLPFVAGRLEVIEGSYEDAPDIEATWFVDPPYQPHSAKNGARTPSAQGNGYAPGCDAAALDFAELGAWCQRRRGEVIVAEQEGADWLPFSRLVAQQDSQGRPKVEVIWTTIPDHQPGLPFELGA